MNSPIAAIIFALSDSWRLKTKQEKRTFLHVRNSTKLLSDFIYRRETNVKVAPSRNEKMTYTLSRSYSTTVNGAYLWTLQS